MGKVSGTRHEGGAVVDELTTAYTCGESVSTETFGRVFGTGELETGGSTALSTSLDSVVLTREEQSGEESTVGALVDDTVGGPTSGELDGAWGLVGVDIVVDGVGSTANLIGVTGTSHLAFARKQGIGDVL